MGRLRSHSETLGCAIGSFAVVCSLVRMTGATLSAGLLGRTVSNMGSRRRWRPRPPMDASAVWDAELKRFVTPAACRLGHPLDEDMRTRQADWREYRCPRCVEDAVADPFFRLQTPARI